ncbi:MAG: hypothetical protein ACKVJG_25725 [Candidatus Latescibacterota bacterium]|jgi:hypothetical protein
MSAHDGAMCPCLAIADQPGIGFNLNQGLRVLLQLNGFYTSNFNLTALGIRRSGHCNFSRFLLFE